MVINLSQELLNEKGEVIKVRDENAQMYHTCNSCLLVDEKHNDDKQTRFNIFLKIRNGGEVELTVEEISVIKKMVLEFAPTIIAGQIITMLEGGKNPLA